MIFRKYPFWPKRRGEAVDGERSESGIRRQAAGAFVVRQAAGAQGGSLLAPGVPLAQRGAVKDTIE